MAKFFTKYERQGLRTYHTLFVCHDDTPIPTGKEIVERFHWHPHFANAPVKQISRLHWFFLVMCDLGGYVFSKHADELEEFAGLNGLRLWRWWDSEEDWCEDFDC